MKFIAKTLLTDLGQVIDIPDSATMWHFGLEPELAKEGKLKILTIFIIPFEEPIAMHDERSSRLEHN